MKKQILLFLIFFGCVALLNAQRANMIFFTDKEEKFFLVVNGIQQNGEPLSNVKITEMSAPNQYSVRIKFADTKLGVIDDKVTVEPDMEKTWGIKLKASKGKTEGIYQIRVVNEIPIDQVQNIHTFPSNQVIVYHTDPIIDMQPEGVSFSMNVNENGGNVNFNMNGGQSQTTTTTSTTTTRSGSVIGSDVQMGGCLNPLNQVQFRGQLDRVRSQNTGAGRKLIANKIAETSCLTSSQIFELCNALFINAERLELAKFCYTRCFDPQNYEVVYNALPISSMVTELDNYITRLGYQHTVITTNPPPQQQIVYVSGYNGPVGCSMPMSNANFSAVKQSIKDADFENTKLSTAKTIIATNCLTTDQVVEVLKMFDFEDTRLQFAKFAYSKTYDKGNYFKINTVFDFDSSKETMNKFVQNGGR